MAFWIVYFVIAAGFVVWMRYDRPRFAGQRRGLAVVWPWLIVRLLTQASRARGSARIHEREAPRQVTASREPVEEIKLRKYGGIEEDDS
jgi:hypothetical protein